MTQSIDQAIIHKHYFKPKNHNPYSILRTVETKVQLCNIFIVTKMKLICCVDAFHAYSLIWALYLWLKIPQVTTHRMGKKCSRLGCCLELWQMTRTFKNRHVGLRVKKYVQILAEEPKGSLLLIQQVSYMGREASPMTHALPHSYLQPPSMPAHGQRATLGPWFFLS